MIEGIVESDKHSALVKPKGQSSAKAIIDLVSFAIANVYLIPYGIAFCNVTPVVINITASQVSACQKKINNIFDEFKIVSNSVWKTIRNRQSL